ncbi:MAG: hypothetical protein KIT16_01820 [Rhodospirillaceae bacterium]|nr:hypothetical protein [Rhodospirillaceae bacterium]
MPTIFILDVPEFAPIAALIEAQPGASKRRLGAYWALSHSGELAVARPAAEVGEAIWFSALTGGFEGKVAEFSAERLRIVAA